ncbi:hypothetical protein GCM10023317_88490 [Actinopolymorpha pittospori]|uniref:Uncharacterized protein n=1 Tax=Actinopolymorpha pittospori TaxID=648752 RepID=A0A927MSA7_9ACTN|nr:hypothetical protein [Actinopolymorpha pittospori]
MGGLGYQDAIDALDRYLAPMTPAPWWGPAVSIDTLRSWLEAAGHCLADRTRPSRRLLLVGRRKYSTGTPWN